MQTERKALLFSKLLKGFDGLLDDETYYNILCGIGMTNDEIEAEGIDLTEQYPRRYAALDELCERLSTFVEHTAEQYAVQLRCGERTSVYLAGQARDFDIDMEDNGMLWDTVMDMLGERLKDYSLDMEVDEGDLILIPKQSAQSEKIKKVVDFIISDGTQSTSSGNWILYLGEFSDIITPEELTAHAEGICAMLEQREEVAEVLFDGESFDVCYYLDFCPNCKEDMGEESSPAMKL